MDLDKAGIEGLQNGCHRPHLGSEKNSQHSQVLEFSGKPKSNLPCWPEGNAVPDPRRRQEAAEGNGAQAGEISGLRTHRL
jgi:hypothetical protein